MERKYDASRLHHGRIILNAVVLLIWLCVIVFALRRRDALTIENIVSYTPEKPFLAVIVLLAMFALKSLSVVVYSGLLYAASGFIFPLPAAILINILGTVVMVSIPYLLGRRIGAEAVEELHRRYPKLQKAERMRDGNDFAFSMLLRSMKILSYDIGSAYLGAVRVHYVPYVLGSITGAMAEIILFPIVGSSLGDLHSSSFWIALGLEMAMTLGSILLIRRRMQGGK